MGDPYEAQARAVLLSLLEAAGVRSIGRSASSDRLKAWSVDDFVEDVWPLLANVFREIAETERNACADIAIWDADKAMHFPHQIAQLIRARGATPANPTT